MKLDKKELSTEDMLIGVGMWLLERPDRTTSDVDDGYLAELMLKIEHVLAAKRGSIH
jgi:hypothetical protein